ncbi:GNAT family N-acetyltransferase [Tropicimonas sp. S265A]|uniref:GNAT family N-acetyltransferase n=1 Tax=Tropicimonas sp. S265A TaxID=3415134 RepID=UPI003C7B655E
MTPADLAALHRACFITPRPWTEPEFADLLANTGAFLETSKTGFALGRVAGPEVELLTLAVAPTARRMGTGRALMTAFEHTALKKGAQEAFLEVAADNAPALELYRRAGYQQAGERSGYYQHSDGERVSALILRKRLAHG